MTRGISSSIGLLGAGDDPAVDVDAERAAAIARRGEARSDFRAEQVLARWRMRPKTAQETMMESAAKLYPKLPPEARVALVERAEEIHKRDQAARRPAGDAAVQRPAELVIGEVGGRRRGAAPVAEAEVDVIDDTDDEISAPVPAQEERSMARMPSVDETAERRVWVAAELTIDPHVDVDVLRGRMNSHFGSRILSSGSFLRDYVGPARELVGSPEVLAMIERGSNGNGASAPEPKEPAVAAEVVAASPADVPAPAAEEPPIANAAEADAELPADAPGGEAEIELSTPTGFSAPRALELPEQGSIVRVRTSEELIAELREEGRSLRSYYESGDLVRLIEEGEEGRVRLLVNVPDLSPRAGLRAVAAIAAALAGLLPDEDGGAA